MFGSLLYLLYWTHLDISFADSKPSQFGSDPIVNHFQAANRVSIPEIWNYSRPEAETSCVDT